MTTGRTGLALLLLLLAACGPSERAGPGADSGTGANVVVVLADTLRAQSLGSYGHSRETDPHLAAFAAGAYLFEDVRAQAPCTYPSANSILTGRDGSRFWVQPGQRIGIPEEVPSLAELLGERGYATVAVSASPIVRENPTRFNPHGGFDRGFDVFDERCLHRDAACVNRVALDYLAVLREPFFLYLHYMDPHDPYRPAKRTWSSESYAAQPDAKPFVAAGDPNPIAEQVYGGGERRFEVTRADLDHLLDLYDDEIAGLDERLGELFGALPLDRTLVAFVSDHGESFLEHGHVKHCQSLYDHQIRTPLVLRVPGAEVGRRVEGLAQNLDLVPTLLDYLEIEAPDLRLDGVSLRPLAEAGEPVHDQVISSWGSLRSVRGERFKLLMDLATGEVELYDLAADPEEAHDLAAEHPREVRRLQSALSAWIREVEGMADTDEALSKARAAHERLRNLGYVE